LISYAISSLSNSIGISSIAARGTRLLTELLAEEQRYFHSSSNTVALSDKQLTGGRINTHIDSDKNLNVAAFVKKFCESDEPLTGNSPVTTHIPLWLQQDEAHQQCTTYQTVREEVRPTNQSGGSYISSRVLSSSMNDNQEGYHLSPLNRQQLQVAPMDPFTQNLTDIFEMKSLNWFDDLLGLAPSHSI
jgi:hypothetical protein